jgi:hypothetical protein
MLSLLCELTELRHFSRRESSPRPPAHNRGRRSNRSNRHLHHRQADAFASAIDGYAGERAMSASVTTTQACPCGQFLRRAACKPLPRSHPGACVKGGIRTRLTVEKYPTSSPPASVEPRASRQTDLRKIDRGAVDAPHVANHLGSLCHRCPAHRLVPSGRPRALGHAHL